MLYISNIIHFLLYLSFHIYTIIPAFLYNCPIELLSRHFLALLLLACPLIAVLMAVFSMVISSMLAFSTAICSLLAFVMVAGVMATFITANGDLGRVSTCLGSPTRHARQALARLGMASMAVPQAKIP